jgi:hypothetical protein
MQGQLFGSDFLGRGIRESHPWRQVADAEVESFTSRLKALYAPLRTDSHLNEAQTEDELIEPVLEALGWGGCWVPQVNLSESGREDVPDFLLLSDADAKAKAMARPDDKRARLGIAILEAKRWLRVLDRGDETDSAARKRRDFGAPSSQMLRYLSRVDVMSDRAVKWGMLTNGAVWRLYWQDARSRAEDFFELDLAAALDVPGVQADLMAPVPRDALKLFLLLFRREAFLPQAWDTQRRTFHAYAHAEARLYEERVSTRLGERVFEEVFPRIANVLAASDLQAGKDAKGRYTRAYLDEVREAALVLLYRLLFVLYAEDRRLLPVLDPRYAPYSLSTLRDDVAAALDGAQIMSNRVTTGWDRLNNLFALIAEGDDAVGMPAYNGGLFERARAPLLARVRAPDAALYPVIDAVSRRTEELFKARINYRDLSVAHLGSIYERLIEYTLSEENGALVARPASFARKVSGSYYTHDDLVRLVLDETVGPLVAEREAEFEKLVKRCRKKPELKPYDWDALSLADTATRLIDLKICDPAMGSGHFLVTLVDWLADRVLEAEQSATDAVNALPAAAHLVEQGRPWVSPVVVRVADIRRRILDAGKQHGWTLDPRQLDDRHIVRRMILKRVVFGVDKNPMAVELAKVALWLHTFTVGAPLSFLDHHLRCGDSLHGERFDAVRDELTLLGTLFQQAELQRLDIAARSLEAVAELTDASIAEARESSRHFDEAARQVAPIQALLDFWRALRWIVPGWPANRQDRVADPEVREAIAELFSDRYNLPAVIASGRIDAPGAGVAAANALLGRAAAIARREGFFHWPTAFPTVWKGAVGGFDAVIGNPPWDRIKLQEVEWFAERRPEIARQARAADRKSLIEKERARDTALWRDYVAARDAAEAGARVVRECGDFPLLSGGDVNLYSLFVERAQSLVHAQGIVGLIAPSGIAADKGAAEFFRGISGGGRLAALLDFENRYNPGGSYFPDVDSRFKFCAFVFGGSARTFESARCAFFLHDLAELADPERLIPLGPADFLRVNPNTGAAPIFRTRRDAGITARIYASHPVLVDRSLSPANPIPLPASPLKGEGAVRRAWPVKYLRMFDMTNDSDKFLTRAELERQGWRPAELNRWKRGEEAAVPLYEGKMVQAYDHRAADVAVNPENLHRPAQAVEIPAGEKLDFGRLPKPQYWVRLSEVADFNVPSATLAFKDVTAPTNARTMIAAMVPVSGYGNTLPLVLLEASVMPLLLANFNSFAFDFLARQKVQGQHLNWYIVEQLPVIAPPRFEDRIGGVRIADFIRDEVLALSYTAHDLEPFARDLGYDGPPFKWDDMDRRQRMARLDALFFHLYGLSADDADYILSTFPIVREKDEKAFGRYLTRDLILAQLARIGTGSLTHEDAQP